LKEEQNPKVLHPTDLSVSSLSLLLHVPNVVITAVLCKQMEQLKMELSMLEELAAD
jgi:hypothetical protein